MGRNLRLDTIELKEPAPIQANAPATVNTCVGIATGSLDIQFVANGTTPYKYLWSTGATTAKITGLAAGPYSATITDAKGCFTSVSGDIIASPITAGNKSITAALCKDVKTGSITIGSVTGGSPTGGNYTFIWDNNGPTNIGPNSVNANIGAGTYKVRILDGTCEGLDSFVVPANRTIELVGTITNPVCNPDVTGRIFVTASARGTSSPPYKFTWTGINAGNITNTAATTLANFLQGVTTPSV